MEDLSNREKQPTVLGVNLVYISVLLLMLMTQLILTKWVPRVTGSGEYYLKLFILEVILIGAPPLVYMLFSKMDIGRVIRFNRIRPAEVLLVIGMAFFGYWVTIIINLGWYWVASHWGTPMGQDLPAIENKAQFFAAILAMGVTPAILEEFLFRGLILRGYEKFGSKMSIIMTGILFGALHLQLMTIPSIILLGIIISYVVYRTDSIFAGMIYHFIHNTLTVAILFFQNIVMKNSGAIEGFPQDINQLPENELMVAMVVWGIIGFFALIAFIACFVAFHIHTKKRGRIRPVSWFELRRSNILEMLPAFLAMIIVLINLVFEILYMSGKINT